MRLYLLVALGGALGSVLRFAVAQGLSGRPLPPFPWATFAVNILGSFAVGVAATLLSLRYPYLRGFFVVGVLGGFTTFSTFEWDLWALQQTGRPGLAWIYLITSCGAGYLAVCLGTWLSAPRP